MSKLLIILGLLFAAYKIYKPLSLPDKNHEDGFDDEDYTDYEEIE